MQKSCFHYKNTSVTKIYFSPEFFFYFSKTVIDYSIEFWVLIEQLTFINSALQISIFNEQSLWNKLFRENIKTFLLFPWNSADTIRWYRKHQRHQSTGLATEIRHPDTTGKGAVHTEKACKKWRVRVLIFSWENYVFLALLATRELRKTSRDSRPASREAGAHRKLSKDKRANTFPFTEGSGRAGACAKLPCSELTPRNPNPSESRALPACGLTTAQWHV